MRAFSYGALAAAGAMTGRPERRRPGRRRSLLSRTQLFPSPIKGHQAPPRFSHSLAPTRVLAASPPARAPNPFTSASLPLAPLPFTCASLLAPPLSLAGPRKSLLGLASGAADRPLPSAGLGGALWQELRGMMGMSAFCTAICYSPALIEVTTAARAASRKALLVLR